MNKLLESSVSRTRTFSNIRLYTNKVIDVLNWIFVHKANSITVPNSNFYSKFKTIFHTSRSQNFINSLNHKTKLQQNGDEKNCCTYFVLYEIVKYYTVKNICKLEARFKTRCAEGSPRVYVPSFFFHFCLLSIGLKKNPIC